MPRRDWGAGAAPHRRRVAASLALSRPFPRKRESRQAGIQNRLWTGSTLPRGHAEGRRNRNRFPNVNLRLSSPCAARLRCFRHGAYALEWSGMSTRSKASSDEPATDRGGRPALPVDSRFRQSVRIVLALALVAAAAWVAADFLPAIAWAVVIAITTWPLYVRFAALIPKWAQRLAAPLLFTAVVGAVLLIPLMLAVHQLAQASDVFVRWVAQLQESGMPVPSWIAQLPFTGDLLVKWWETNLSNPQTASQWLRGVNVESLTAWTRALGGEFLHRLLLFALTLIALFLLYRNGGSMSERALATADRFLGDPGERLASKIVEAVRGTVNGTVAIAVIEGVIIGIAYVVIGAPNALLLTLLTITLAMLPLGVEIAVSLVSLLLLVQGFSFLPVLALFAFGMAVTIVGDNFMWPALVGRSARLPFLLALVGVLGGVQTFGLIGLFIGPVIMAALLVVWREWIAPPD
ncbi:MAG: AI-2E family transporter [Rhizobiales bacterium]|nr:AI-2E family transporter [Hyphomicrobiales bacterium]